MENQSRLPDSRLAASGKPVGVDWDCCVDPGAMPATPDIGGFPDVLEGFPECIFSRSGINYWYERH
jgi:hypothetical protein